jgi:fibronectin-binding autotransporter adhesin
VLLCGASLAAVALFVAPSAAVAQSVYWDANGSSTGSGGTGNWNTTTALWSQSNSDVLGPYQTWVNNAGSPNNAIFGLTAAGTTTTAGTITLTEPIIVHNLTFQTVNNWKLTGSTLTLGGLTPTINTAGLAQIDSIIAGNAGFTKTGAQQLYLTGANTFTGDITLSAGTLRAATDASLGAAGNNITVNGASTILQIDSGTTARTVSIGSSYTLQINGSGVGSAKFTGAGNLNVSYQITLNNNANDYTGVTTFGSCNGTCSNYFTSIRDVGGGPSSLGAPTTVANGTITFQQASQYYDNLIYLGSGDSSNRNWIINASNVASTFWGARILNQGTGTLNLTGNIALSGAGGTQFLPYTADLGLTGVISGASPVYFFGGAVQHTVTLGGANSYTGDTGIGYDSITVSSGAVKVAAPVLADAGTISSLGTGSNINLTGGGTLSYIGTGNSSNRTWTADGSVGILNEGTGALTLSGGLSFVSNSTADTLTFGGTYAGTSIFSGVISGTGTVASNGSTTWQLSGANTFTGPVLVNGGTLQAGSASAFGALSGVTVNGGTLDLNGFALATPTLSGSGGAVALGSATLTVNGSANGSYAGAINGTGGLTKSGTGTLTLTGTSGYSGPTTVGGGTLALTFPGAGSNILSSASSLNMAGGTIVLTGAAGQANSQTFNGLNVTAGNNKMSAVGTGGGTMTVNLGTISHSGGLMDFTMSGGGSIRTTSADGALGWATVNGSDYAQITGGVITAFTSYVNKDDAGTWLTGDIVSDAGGAANSPYTGTVAGNVQLGGMKYTAAANSTVTVGSGATLGVDGTIIVSSSVGSATQTITGGSLTGTSGGGTLGIQQNGAGNFTVASTIVDNGGAVGFTKGGTGQVTLTNNNNSYTGATTLSGGILSVANIGNGGVNSGIGASSAASSNLVLQSGAFQYTGATATTDRGFTLVNGGASRSIDISNAGTNLTFTGLVTAADSASLLKSGPGTLTLANGGNNYTGATTVSGGILSVGTLSNGGVASGIGAASSSAANLVLQTGGTLQYTGGTTGIDRGFTLASGNGGVDVSQATTTLTVGGTVTGAGALNKTGAGTLILSGTNNFSGGVSLTAGTLRAGSSQAFGTGGATVASGATLDLNNFNATLRGLGGGGTVSIGTATLTVNPNANPNFTGTITGTGGVVVSGGAQTFSGCNNSYTGPTSLQGSTVLYVDCLANGGQPSGIGASSNASTNLLFNNGSLYYTGTSVTTDRGFQLTAGVGAIGVTDSTATLTMTGQVVGAGQLRKDGSGTLVLAGNNSYSGNTSITAGTLRAGSSTAFGTGLVSIANTAGATLDVGGLNVAIPYVTGGGTTGGAIALSGGGTLTLTNPGGAATFAGIITGNGNLTLNGALTETLTNCNSSYTGVTTINAGVFEAACLTNGGGNSSIGASTSAAGNLVLNGGTLRYIGSGGSTDRQFTLGSSATSALDASGTGPILFTNTGAISFSSANTSQTVTLTGTSTADNKLGAQIVDNGTGKTSFTKSGAGTWILTNSASSYTGVTTISGGVLGVDKLANGGAPSSIGSSAGTPGHRERRDAALHRRRGYDRSPILARDRHHRDRILGHGRRGVRQHGGGFLYRHRHARGLAGRHQHRQQRDGRHDRRPECEQHHLSRQERRRQLDIDRHQHL